MRLGERVDLSYPAARLVKVIIAGDLLSLLQDV
jgi:hypothetical protein